MNTRRQRAVNTALLLLGGALGATVALQAARVLELRMAQEALLHYGQSILRVAQSSAVEAAAAVRQFSDDGMPFCSDGEIAAMRRFVYNAAFVRDVGRERGGLLYCTSGLGRLSKPPHMPAPVLSYFSDTQSEQVQIIPDQSLALAPNSNGLLAVANGVSVVLNPALYASLDNPPMRATGMVKDARHQAVLLAFGHLDPLSSQEVLKQRMVLRDGIYYQPLCSTSYGVCIVASEARADMLARQSYYVSFPITTALFTAAGAIL